MDWLNFFRITGYIAIFFGVICTIGVDYLKNKQDKNTDAIKDKQMTELVTDVKDSKKFFFDDSVNFLFVTLTIFWSL